MAPSNTQSDQTREAWLTTLLNTILAHAEAVSARKPTDQVHVSTGTLTRRNVPVEAKNARGDIKHTAALGYVLYRPAATINPDTGKVEDFGWQTFINAHEANSTKVGLSLCRIAAEVLTGADDDTGRIPHNEKFKVICDALGLTGVPNRRGTATINADGSAAATLSYAEGTVFAATPAGDRLRRIVEDHIKSAGEYPHKSLDVREAFAAGDAPLPRANPVQKVSIMDGDKLVTNVNMTLNAILDARPKLAKKGLSLVPVKPAPTASQAQAKGYERVVEAMNRPVAAPTPKKAPEKVAA